MPGTPPAVRHYVSDCLAERVPYDPQKGFAGARARDAGRVFDGVMPGTLDTLQHTLTNAQSHNEQRARAAHLLCAHAASQEVKMKLIQRGLASSVTAALTPLLPPAEEEWGEEKEQTGMDVDEDALTLERECFLLLRSLCILPHGCYATVQSGGLRCVLQSLQWVGNNGSSSAASSVLSLREKRCKARTAAAEVLYQLSCNMAGRVWMLDVDDYTELRFADASNSRNSDDAFSVLVSLSQAHREPSHLDKEAITHAHESEINTSSHSTQPHTHTQTKVACTLSLDASHTTCSTASASTSVILSPYSACLQRSATQTAQGRAVMECVAGVLAHDATDSPVTRQVLRALAQLTEVSQGVRMAISSSRLMDSLTQVTAAAAAVGAAAVVSDKKLPDWLTSVLEVLWNIAMDARGVEELGERGPVPTALWEWFAVCCLSTSSPCTETNASARCDEAAIGLLGRGSETTMRVARVLMGVLSALYKRTAMKLDSVLPMGTYPTRVHALLDYLRRINVLVDAARAAGAEPSMDVTGVSKNTLQCIRLASEVKEVRDVTHRYLEDMEAIDAKEAFYLRRQLYFSTKWQDEYNAHV